MITARRAAANESSATAIADAHYAARTRASLPLEPPMGTFISSSRFSFHREAGDLLR
jgi:hypothetical protein